jgi:hypothetical protein
MGDVVCAVSLRRPFHKKNDDAIEVARFCSKLDFSVAGGLSKLVAVVKTWAVENNYAKIITYVDTRLGGVGKGYETVGFTRVGDTPMRWWWTDMANRFNRFKFRANSKEGLTEVAVATVAGVVKIWGCKNIVYEMKL